MSSRRTYTGAILIPRSDSGKIFNVGKNKVINKNKQSVPAIASVKTHAESYFKKLCQLFRSKHLVVTCFMVILLLVILSMKPAFQTTSKVRLGELNEIKDMINVMTHEVSKAELSCLSVATRICNLNSTLNPKKMKIDPLCKKSYTILNIKPVVH